MPASILLEQVFHQWPGANGFTLRVPSLRVDSGERVLLLGESGSGKSTLLSLICGTLPAREGRVQILGTDLGALTARERDRFRAESIGIIFQQFNLLPYATVTDNIRLPLRFAPERRRRAGEPLAEAERLCDALGLPPAVVRQPAGRLSVGQQQRVAIARALIGRPPLIVADEPTSSLDANSQAEFLRLMFSQIESAGTSLLMVSHDARLGAQFDRTIELADIVTRGNA
jgi:putative ABC transport system ATP-binding protein